MSVFVHRSTNDSGAVPVQVASSQFVATVHRAQVREAGRQTICKADTVRWYYAVLIIIMVIM